MPCDICRQIPHAIGCPYADDPVSIYKCKTCRGEIFEGEQYYYLNDDIVCTECLFIYADKYLKTAEKESEEDEG